MPIPPAEVARADTEPRDADERANGAPPPRLLFLLGLSILLVAASVLRELVAPTDVGRGADRRDWLIAVVFSAIGGRIVARRQNNAVGWLMALQGGTSAIAVFTATYASASILLAWMSQWTWWLSFGFLPLLLMLFPDGRLPSPRWRAAGWVAISGIVVPAALLAVAAIGQVDLLNGDRMPTGIHRSLVVAFVFATVLTAGSTVMGVVALLLRWRRAGGDEHQQLKWLLFGAVIALMAALVDFFLGLPGAWLVSAGAVPIAAGIAITKYHLYDIDPIINRSILYACLTAAIVGLYDGVTSIVGNALQRSGLPVSLISAGVVAAAFLPLREWLQRTVDRLMYGERSEPYIVLSRLSQCLETTLAPESVLPSIVETIAHTLKLSFTGIELRHGPTTEVAAETGKLVDEPLRLSLIYQGEVIGQLVLGPRAPGEVFSAADQRLLADVARQVGVAAYAVRLTAELQRSRERLAQVLDEERQRLRRDLHERLDSMLTRLALELRAISSMAHDPAKTEALVERVRAEMQADIADIWRSEPAKPGYDRQRPT